MLLYPGVNAPALTCLCALTLLINIIMEPDAVGSRCRTKKNVFNKLLQAVPVRKCWRLCTVLSKAVVPLYSKAMPYRPQKVFFKSS